MTLSLRPDLEIISEWIRPGARVLDLGCGDGTLLRHLRDTRRATVAYGLEIENENIVKCVASGVNVLQRDIDAGLSDFDAESFDYVVMTQTLQAVRYPIRLVNEILRIGKEGIVTFPNMGYWRYRVRMTLAGRVPVAPIIPYPSIPYEWHNTPNIHLCTLRDFEQLCMEQDIRILQRTVVDNEHRRRPVMGLLPNLLGQVALYRFTRK